MLPAPRLVGVAITPVRSARAISDFAAVRKGGCPATDGEAITKKRSAKRARKRHRGRLRYGNDEATEIILW